MINLHNHTTFSDGRFAPEEIVQAALEGGLTHIGISDHFRTAKLAATAEYVGIEELDAYVQHIRTLAARYADKISVLAGLEIDFSERTPLDQFWLKGFSRTPLNDLDYVLFEYVGDREWKGLPLSALLSYRRWIHVPVGLAHTLVSRSFAAMPPEQFAQTLAQYEIFIELCPSDYYSIVSSLSGERIPHYRDPDPYNSAVLAACQESGVLFSIGSDTHRRISEVADVKDALAFLQEKGLSDHLVTARYWRRDVAYGRSSPANVSADI